MTVLTARSGDTGGNALLRIDDASSRLEYTGQWTAGIVNGTGSGSDQHNVASIHTSSSAGATVKFAFNGTFVAVYGVIKGNAVSLSFTMDGGDSSPYQVPQPPNSEPQTQWPFYSSPPLSSGLHELSATLDSGTFNLDYLTYTASNALDNLGDASEPVQGSPSVAPSSSTPSAFGLSSRPLSTGAAVGLSLGAVAVVAFIAFSYFILRRRPARRVRHRRSTEKPLDMTIDPDESVKTPPTAARRTFRGLSRIYRPTPARSTQSSKTASSSAPTSITQSSAMFTSVIMLSPALSMVSEETGSNRV